MRRLFAAAAICALLAALPARAQQIIVPPSGGGSGGCTTNCTFTSVTTGQASASGATTGPIAQGTLSFSDTGLAQSWQASIAGYLQTVLQNTSNNAAASADYIVTNDQGTATTHYGDFGINSSTFSGTGSLALAGATYLYSQTGDLVIGSNTANAVHFLANNAATDAITISSANAVTINGTPTLVLTNATGLVASTGTTATGTPSSSTYLRGDNTWATPSGGSGCTVGGTAGQLVYNNGSTGCLSSSATVTSGGQVTLGAGSASAAPLNIPAGTNLTTASAGAIEFDGTAFYADQAASTRGVIPTQQWCVLSANFTLTSQTAAQPAFNCTANGAVTLPVGTYSFDIVAAMTGLSSTSGAYGFAIGGTATLTQGWASLANKITTLTTSGSALTGEYSTAANTGIMSANANTSAVFMIRGILRVTVAGTVIPEVSLGVASAAVIQANSYAVFTPIGSSSVTNVGNWN
jgi:hypothetical protein